MGVDISAYIERKNKNTGAWEQVVLYKPDGTTPVGTVYAERDHVLFDALQNSYGERGVPKDVSPQIAALAEEAKTWGWGKTYFTFSELFLLAEKAEEKLAAEVKIHLTRFKYDENYSLDLCEEDIELEKESSAAESLREFCRVLKYFYTLSSGYEDSDWSWDYADLRVVLWFDN